MLLRISTRQPQYFLTLCLPACLPHPYTLQDLDVDTLGSLEEALQEFNGSCIIISHDRAFLDRLCTGIIAFGEDGKVDVFHGNYSNYTKWKGGSG